MPNTFKGIRTSAGVEIPRKYERYETRRFPRRGTGGGEKKVCPIGQTAKAKKRAERTARKAWFYFLRRKHDGTGEATGEEAGERK